MVTAAIVILAKPDILNKMKTKDCSICSQIADEETADQKHGDEENNTYLPVASHELKVIKDFTYGSRQKQLKRCPECKTYYFYRTDYEFLIGGSEDEEYLNRLTDAEAKKYLDRPSYE
jgi:protein-arginine kinase activator protein McsA